MATFKDSLTKWFFKNSSTAGATTSRIPLLDASGNPIGSNTITNVGNLLAQTTPLMSALDGVFIMYHRVNGNIPNAVSVGDWPSLQASGETADGVMIVDGGRVLVVAPTESDNLLPFASAAVSGGGTTTTDRVTAYSDWAGKTNTASQITHAEMSDTGYAPGFCANYSRGGLGAGKWWLPSEGELMLICANLQKINYALSLIDGATKIPTTGNDFYHTSTEQNATSSYCMRPRDFYLTRNVKATDSRRVRPVSAFIQ